MINMSDKLIIIGFSLDEWVDILAGCRDLLIK